jgi:hypothetical protein
MNDHAIMPVEPTPTENGTLLISVLVTLFLAWHVLIERIGGIFTSNDISSESIIASGVLAVIGALALYASVVRDKRMRHAAVEVEDGEGVPTDSM